VIDLAPLLRIGIFLVRPGLLIAAAPAFGGTWAPAPVKIGLTVILATICMAVVPVPAAGEPAGLALILTREAVIGFALGFAVRLLVSGAEMAGQLAGFQLGFAYASVVDPQSGVRNNVLSSACGLTALLVFLGLNAHHDLVRALVASYDVLPIGVGSVDDSLPEVVARMLGLVLVLGVRLAAPVLIVLLVVELALGLASRAAPTLNLMAQGFPVRLLVGLITLAAMIRVIPAVVARAVPAALELAAELAQALR
jgi:flagellar biosynthetic protein FliR